MECSANIRHFTVECDSNVAYLTALTYSAAKNEGSNCDECGLLPQWRFESVRPVYRSENFTTIVARPVVRLERAFMRVLKILFTK